jgi:2-oxoglutarate dehydrogenase E1 component
MLCAGKLFYELDEQRRVAAADDVAIYRLELLYPFPSERLRTLLERHRAVEDVVWVQEEPKNMGAWSHVNERLPELLAPNQRLRYVGRPRAASPATGSYKRHVREQESLVAEVLAPAGSPVTPR